MATSFDRWEKDPFFSAAEEVQESADRMESTYRTWIHAKKDASSIWDFDELCRDLRTTLGTTKWQLEEFERAVRSSYIRTSNDDSVDRHREFIVAIEANISKVENSLKESSFQGGKASVPWARLDERESNEFALFLAGPLESEDMIPSKSRSKERERKGQVSDEEQPLECLKGWTRSAEWGSNENKEEKPVENEKVHGHRRTASACIDSGAWKISVFDDSAPPSSSAGQPLRKVPSLAGFFSITDSAPKNGFRKWKATDFHQDSDTSLLRPVQLTKGGINACYEKSKSCLDSCDDCYDKQLYGWYGAIQRQFQRSQYQMQYSRPVQMTIWIVLLLCLIVLIALRVV